MPEKMDICPLCGGGDNLFFDRRIFRGMEVVNRICRDCGFVFQSPRMTRQETSDFYAREYRRLYQGGEEPVAKDLGVQHARALSLVDFMQPIFQHFPRHLDIGCSTGIFMQSVQKAYADKTVGIEPGKAYREYAHRQGLNVFESLEELKRKDPEPFDLISMVHVLEHIPDPLDYLAALRKDVLIPQGWLLIEVPNLFAHDCFEVAHLVSFSPHTLRQLVQEAGYEIRRFERHGRPYSEMIPFYLTLLVRALSRPSRYRIRPERSVAIKRRLGLANRKLMARFFPKKAWQPIK